MIEPNERLATRFNICGASALVTVSASGLVPFRVINPNSKPVKIFRFTNLGRFLRSEENIVNILSLADESYNDSMPQEFSQCHEVTETATDYDISHDLTPEQVHQLEHLLIQNTDIFSQGPHDLGRTSIVRHEITTNGSPPIRQRPYRTAPPQRELITQHITSMLEADIIEPSVSPWASPVVLVKKKDGSTRFCIDYRKLNAVTKKDSYPIPHIQESLDLLGQTQYFTTLDLFSGYWQVEMNESSKEYTAFTTYDGLYQFKVLPFGLCNAPSTFQRLMESVLRGLNWKICLIYIDDIIIFSKSFEEHLAHIDLVFARLRAANIKLKASKCHFAYPQVTYLGHIVSRHGIQPDPDKVSAVREFPIPKKVKDVRSFLGLANYYRRFIKNFAHIAGPLTALLRKNAKFQWTAQCQNAFDTLKQSLISAPILNFPDFTLPFELYVDASLDGLGMTLGQIQNGKDVVIAYAGRSLNSAELSYSATEKEALAVIEGIKKFQPYLHGRKFTVHTDHHALKWLMTIKDVTGRLARWSLFIQQF